MRIFNYEIVKPINSGGTANVYLAVDLHNGQLVALKKLKNGLLDNPVMLEKFIDEANRYLYLNHPNIVKCYDFYEDANSYHIVIEYMQGKCFYELTSIFIYIYVFIYAFHNIVDNSSSFLLNIYLYMYKYSHITTSNIIICCINMYFL